MKYILPALFIAVLAWAYAPDYLRNKKEFVKSVMSVSMLIAIICVAFIFLMSIMYWYR